MNYPQIKSKVKKHQNQSLQLRGINLTDNYADGQMESCKGISTNRFPYITTADKLVSYDAGVPSGYKAVSMFAWEKLFVVSDKPTYVSAYDDMVTGRTYHAGDHVMRFETGWVLMSGTKTYSSLPNAGTMSSDGWLIDPPPVSGYKCYYGGDYCGDLPSITLPKQYAVVGSKLVVWPDKVMFDLKEETITAQSMNTAPILATVNSGTIEYRKAVQ